MLILDKLISLYAPFNCLGCGIENKALLCPICTQTIPPVPSRCYRCMAVTHDYAVCDRCRRYTPLRHVTVAVHYDGVAKELLHTAKYERAVHGLSEIAEIMKDHMEHLYEEGYDYIVPVPTATSRVRQRGYDQAEVLASHIARGIAIPNASLLLRFGQAHQVGAGRITRLKQLQGAFRLKDTAKVSGRRLLLVDDVITTGATLEAAAAVLKKAGAARVDAIVFAQPSEG